MKLVPILVGGKLRGLVRRAWHAKCSGCSKPLLMIIPGYAIQYVGDFRWGLPRFILGNPLLTSHYKGTREHIGLGHTAQWWRVADHGKKPWQREGYELTVCHEYFDMN